MNDIFLGFGSNLGDSETTIRSTIHKLIEEGWKLQAHSSWYISEPWGMKSEHQFTNSVARFSTHENAITSLKITQALEQKFGRIKTKHYSDRLIDIDILFFNDLVLKSSELMLPHPHILNRRFVLEPLAEIAPNWIHPTAKQTILECLEQCPDSGKVEVKPSNNDFFNFD